MTICIFAGPTLTSTDLPALPGACYLPPAAQGDIFRAALTGPRVIALIDGYFEHKAAVWHKELLWAMAEGIHVYGAASMGALRAAELAVFGMEGVGEVFVAYRDGILEDDDEVAVAHTLSESGYRCLSEAMVNIRATLARAAAEGILCPATQAGLLSIAKSLFYPERSYPLLLRRAAEQGLRAAELCALSDWLPQGAVNLKRQDALALLQLLQERSCGEALPKRVSYKMEHTDFWYEAMRSAMRGQPEAGAGADAAHSDRAVLEELRMSGAAYLEAREQALLRDLGLAVARHDGGQASTEALALHTQRFRRRHGLGDPEAEARFLADNHLTAERLESLLREEAQLAKICAERDVHQHLLDRLRVSGEYASFLARAEDKERRLREAGLLSPTLSDAGVTEEELVRWYFARLGPLFPQDLRQQARTLEFSHEGELLLAVLREYCYARLIAEAP